MAAPALAPITRQVSGRTAAVPVPSGPARGQPLDASVAELPVLDSKGRRVQFGALFRERRAIVVFVRVSAAGRREQGPGPQPGWSGLPSRAPGTLRGGGRGGGGTRRPFPGPPTRGAGNAGRPLASREEGQRAARRGPFSAGEEAPRGGRGPALGALGAALPCSAPPGAGEAPCGPQPAGRTRRGAR